MPCHYHPQYNHFSPHRLQYTAQHIEEKTFLNTKPYVKDKEAQKMNEKTEKQHEEQKNGIIIIKKGNGTTKYFLSIPLSKKWVAIS